MILIEDARVISAFSSSSSCSFSEGNYEKNQCENFDTSEQQFLMLLLWLWLMLLLLQLLLWLLQLVHTF